MSDASIVLMALAALAGALLPHRLPLWLVVAGAALAVGLRFPLAMIVAVALLVSTLSARSWSGLVPGDMHEVDAVATLVTDPRPIGRGTQVVLRIAGTRYDSWAFGGVGATLQRGLAGQQYLVSGTASAFRGPPQRQAAMHTPLRLAVDQARRTSPGSSVWRSANGFRSLLSRGADGLGVERRSLFTGIVYGDDRYQSPETEADFRAVGLTHLLAVSGQNVAFVLTLVRPLIGRLTLRGRWAATLGVLLFFAFVTRFEPSVLRATAMAGFAATAHLLGRPTSGMRVLALAVTALLIIDPLLAWTIAFRLSVAASAGILLLAPRLELWMRGPRWLRETASVTLAAQLAVAPIIITTFGGMSPMSIPANIAAGPAAGPLMMWGLTGGVAAGVFGGRVATLLHVPTRALLWWLETVAATFNVTA